MIGFYALAKGLELFDYQVGEAISTGGHPWKHLAGAVAMLCCLSAIESRQPATNHGFEQPNPARERQSIEG